MHFGAEELIELASHIDEKKEPKTKAKSSLTLKIILIIAAAVIVLAVAVIFGGGLVADAFNPKILNGVSVAGINLSGKTKAEAVEILKENISDISTKTIKIQYGEIVSEKSFSELMAGFDIDQTVNNAYSQGRGANLFSRVKSEKELAEKGVNLDYAAKENEAAIKTFVDDFIAQIDTEYIASGYEKTADSITINAGKDGKTTNRAALLAAISSGFSTLESAVIDAEVDVAPANLDLDAIATEVITPAVDAVITYDSKGNYTISDEKDGFGFDLETAKGELQSGNGKSATYPLKVLKPKKTKSGIQASLFTQTLATRTTSLNPGEVDRTHNVRLAASLLNGAVVSSGETFSINKRVGPRTAERGFRMAKIYASGEIVDGLGGGLCQVSSTLYSAVLRTNLQIVERKNHMFTVGYVPLGEDATLYWGSIDFKFKNTMDMPIRISASQSGSSCTVSLIGAFDSSFPKGTKIKISNVTTATAEYQTVEQVDTTLAPGTRKVTQKGSPGYTIKSYKIYVDANGNEIKRTLIGTSVYKPANKIIKVGSATAPADTTPTDPGGTTNPTDPGGTTNPTDPGGTGGNTDPGGTTNPTDPGGTGGNTDPGGTTNPTDPGGTGGNTDPERTGG